MHPDTVSLAVQVYELVCAENNQLSRLSRIKEEIMVPATLHHWIRIFIHEIHYFKYRMRARLLLKSITIKYEFWMKFYPSKSSNFIRNFMPFSLGIYLQYLTSCLTRLSLDKHLFVPTNLLRHSYKLLSAN